MNKKIRELLHEVLEKVWDLPCDCNRDDLVAKLAYLDKLVVDEEEKMLQAALELQRINNKIDSFNRRERNDVPMD